MQNRKPETLVRTESIAKEMCLTTQNIGESADIRKSEAKIHTILLTDFTSGDGVTRDVISEFIGAVMVEFDGACEKVPRLSHDEELLVGLGKALSQGYLQYGLFPPSLCRASLIFSLLGECSDDALYRSFLNFLPGNSGLYTNKHSIIGSTLHSKHEK